VRKLLRSTRAFVIGVVVAISVLAGVNGAWANSDSQIKACANRKTGEMRYLVRGSCKKKTEISMTWSSSGSQGPAGIAGPAGSPGPAGADGTNLVVVDASGKVLGSFLDIQGGTSVTFLTTNGEIWTASMGANKIVDYSYYFADSSCSTPYLVTDLDLPIEREQVRYFRPGFGAYKAVGEPIEPAQVDVYTFAGQGANRVCTFIPNANKSGYFSIPTERLLRVSIVASAPSYEAPLKVVRR
jgi:hypothetical protein